jgi:hypothetical protein
VKELVRNADLVVGCMGQPCAGGVQDKSAGAIGAHGAERQRRLCRADGSDEDRLLNPRGIEHTIQVFDSHFNRRLHRARGQTATTSVEGHESAECGEGPEEVSVAGLLPDQVLVRSVATEVDDWYPWSAVVPISDRLVSDVDVSDRRQRQLAHAHIKACRSRGNTVVTAHVDGGMQTQSHRVQVNT